MDFAGTQIEGDAFEGTNSAEGFGNGCQLEERFQYFIRELRELTRISEKGIKIKKRAEGSA